MNIKESALEVIEHLRGLADGSIEPTFLWGGVCREMDGFFGNIHYFLGDMGVDSLGVNINNGYMYEDWEFYSGLSAFPIKSTDECTNAGICYITNTDIMWNDDTEYGRMRLDLCDYLADYLEEIYF